MRIVAECGVKFEHKTCIKTTSDFISMLRKQVKSPPPAEDISAFLQNLAPLTRNPQLTTRN